MTPPRPALPRIRPALAALLLALSVASAAAPSPAPAMPGPAASVPAPSAAPPAAAIAAGERDDARKREAIEALLARQPALQGVQVKVDAGIATLTGEVLADADRARAATLAKQVEGVVEVDNQVQLSADLRARLGAAMQLAEAKLLRLLGALPLLLAAIAIVALAAWLGRLLSRRTHWLRLRSSNPYMDALVRRVVQTVVVLAGIIVALDLLGATTLVGAVLGSAGVVGLVLGFGFRDITENYIAGVLLSLRQPFSPGDHIVVENREGKVVALNARSTILITLDGNELRLPNALVFKSVVLNYSHNPQRRFEFTIPIDPAESIREAQQLALAEIAGIEGVLAEPAPSWLVHEYGAKGIVLRFFGWVDQHRSDLGKVRSEAIRQVKAAYTRAGIDLSRDSTLLVSEPRSVAAGKAEPQQAGGVDTSVNRDIDRQLAAAQRARGDNNLLDGQPRSKE